MSQAKEYIVKVKDPKFINSLLKELKSWNVQVSNLSRVGFVGFTARMGTLISKWYKNDARIETIEEIINYELQSIQTITSEYMWYLDRIDQPTLPLVGTFSYLNTGQGVTIYTVDSGVSYNHVELFDRVESVYDPNFPDMIFDPVIDQRIYENSSDYNEFFPRGGDELGHGTFIAGLLVGPTYGVAKGATVRSAKVFGQSATTSGRILAGLNAVRQDYLNRGSPKSIVNLSLASLAPPVTVTSTSTTAVANSSFTINSNQITLVTGSINEIVTKINALVLPSIVASANANGRLEISLKTLGTLVLVDGTQSPLSQLGITPGTYQNGLNLVEQAIIQMMADGMHVVISAGNYGIDSSLVTPARIGSVSSAIIVGATDRTDKLADFTNSSDHEFTLGNINSTSLSQAAVIGSCYGSAVSLYAPGMSMQSAWLPSYNTGIDLYNESLVSSGTSFASPLVAGAVALVLESSSVLPSIMKSNIVSGASNGVITNLPFGSTNKLLNITSIDQTITWVNSSPPSVLSLYSTQEFFISAVSYLGQITQYEVINGSLPVGLFLDSVTGKISGVIAGSNLIGTTTVTVKAFNGMNSGLLDMNGVIDIDFNIAEGTIPARWNTPEDLSKIREGDQLAIFLSADNLALPSTPITYNVVGNLPYGWILFDGQIIGKAPIATNGDFEVGFTINANDSLTDTPRTFKITIEQNNSYNNENEPFWITDSGIIGSFVENTNVNFQLLASDLVTDPSTLTYNLSVISGDGSIFSEFGQLPPGLSLDPNTGIISGQLSPIQDDIESFEFAVYLSDSANVVANLFSIIVIKDYVSSTVIWDTESGNLASLNQNEIIDVVLLAHDTNNLPISYHFVSGELPNGAIFNQDGTISGTILDNEDRLYVFTILASNGYSGAYATFSILSIKTNIAPEWVLDSNLGNFSEGSFVNIQLAALDADNDQLTFYSNDLPLGLYIQGEYLMGTLDSVDVDTEIEFTITVSDITSNPISYLESSRLFTLTITDGALNPNSPPVWLTPAGPLPSGITNNLYSTSLIAVDPEGDVLRYQLVDGLLPPGLTLDQINGVITGTIDVIVQDTGYDFTISVTDGVFEVERLFNIFVSSATVNQPPEWITGSNLGTVVDGVPKTITFVANDPEGTIVTYSFVSGSLPPGMLFNNASGQLSGIPSITTSQQVFQFVIRATDSNLNSADQQFDLTISKVANIPPVWITPPGQLLGTSGVIDYHPGDYVNFQFEATDPDNGPLSLSYRLSNNSPMPYGLTLSITGLLTGFVGDVYSETEVSFAVEASDGFDVSTRNFIIKFLPTPNYTGVSCDLYIPLSVDLVQLLNQWNTDELIPSNILYEPTAPTYGRRSSYDILVTNNLQVDDKNIIQNILGPRHKAFSSLMGIPTYATGRDNYGNALYEVIYIPMIDSQLGSDFNIPTAGNLQYYSKSFDNLRQELDIVPNNEFLPSWMRSVQDDNITVLGYVPAIVLAYVQPGRAKTVVQALTQIINQTSFNIQETTFDRHVLIGERIDPSVTAGSQMVVEGVLITFSGGDIITTKNEIENALLAAGINNIRIYLEDSVEYKYISNRYVPVYGKALRFNYSNNYITLVNIIGTPCEELGFKSQDNVETTFDNQAVHFDYSLILDEKQNIQSDGLTFVGKELVFDRYVGQFTNGKQFQLKWAPDYQQTFYDTHKKEFWSSNPPVWITPPGELGYIATALPSTIQLRTKHHLADQIVSYEVVFGSLPPGFTLNSSTGIISGIAGEEGSTTFFTVRAYDKWGNYKDRGFTLSVGANLLRIKQFIILIGGYGIQM